MSRQNDLHPLPAGVSGELLVHKVLEVGVEACHEFCTRGDAVGVKARGRGHHISFLNHTQGGRDVRREGRMDDGWREGGTYRQTERGMEGGRDRGGREKEIKCLDSVYTMGYNYIFLPCLPPSSLT